MSFAPPPEFPDDSDNPYAPPKAEIGARPVEADLVAVPATVGDVLARAWEIYKARMGICIGVVVGCNAIYWAYSILLNVFMAAAQGANSPAVANVIQMVGGLAGVVLQIWLTIGQTLVMLKVAKGLHAQFGDVTTGGRYILTMLGASIIFGATFLGLVIVCLAPGGITLAATGKQDPVVPVVFVIGGMLALVLWIVIAIRLSQFAFLIVDRNAGVIRSLQLSNQITKGSELQIFLVWVASALINLGGLLLLCVGLIFTIPFTFLVSAVLYVALTGQSSARPLGPDDFLPGAKPPTDADFTEPL